MKNLNNYLVEKLDENSSNFKKFIDDVTEIVRSEIFNYKGKFSNGENTNFKIKKSREDENALEICFTKDDIHITNAEWFFHFERDISEKIEKLPYLKSFHSTGDGIRRKIYIYPEI